MSSKSYSEPDLATTLDLDRASGRSKRLRRWLIAILLVGVVVVIVVVWKNAGKSATTQFETQEAQRGDLVVLVTATGTLQPTNEVEVGSEISGIPLTDALFDSLEKGMVRGITSYLTLMEILTRPKAMGDAEAARDYEYYLTTFPNLKVYEMDLEVARKASDLRAVEKIKAPDAIQIATAIVHGATGFLTNDRIFTRIKGIDVLILDKLL